MEWQSFATLQFNEPRNINVPFRDEGKSSDRNFVAH